MQQHSIHIIIAYNQINLTYQFSCLHFETQKFTITTCSSTKISTRSHLKNQPQNQFKLKYPYTMFTVPITKPFLRHHAQQCLNHTQSHLKIKSQNISTHLHFKINHKINSEFHINSVIHIIIYFPQDTTCSSAQLFTQPSFKILPDNHTS